VPIADEAAVPTGLARYVIAILVHNASLSDEVVLVEAYPEQSIYAKREFAQLRDTLMGYYGV
jgi:hypothetical protein